MSRRQSDVTEFREVPSVPELYEWYAKLNGRISLGSRPNSWSGHLDGEWIDVVVPAANTDFPVTHNLGRVPMAFFQCDLGTDAGPLRRNAATPAHTVNQLWVRTTSAAGSTFRIWVF
jgi:hypothetical protein